LERGPIMTYHFFYSFAQECAKRKINPEEEPIKYAYDDNGREIAFTTVCRDENLGEDGLPASSGWMDIVKVGEASENRQVRNDVTGEKLPFVRPAVAPDQGGGPG
jgi:hypothetical protein